MSNDEYQMTKEKIVAISGIIIALIGMLLAFFFDLPDHYGEAFNIQNIQPIPFSLSIILLAVGITTAFLGWRASSPQQNPLHKRSKLAVTVLVIVVLWVVVIAGLGAFLYSNYPKVLGIELPGSQFSQAHIQNNNDYFSLQSLGFSSNGDNVETFAIFSTNQYGKINWQSSNIVIIPYMPVGDPHLILDAFYNPLHSGTSGTLYLCYVSNLCCPEKSTSNYILAFNASTGELEATYQYNISEGSFSDFFVYDDNTFYFGALTSTINGSIDIEAYNYNINGIVSQLWNNTIANVSNGWWSTGADIVDLSNGYLIISFPHGSLVGQTYWLNANTGELIH